GTAIFSFIVFITNLLPHQYDCTNSTPSISWYLICLKFLLTKVCTKAYLLYCFERATNSISFSLSFKIIRSEELRIITTPTQPKSQKIALYKNVRIGALL